MIGSPAERKTVAWYAAGMYPALQLAGSAERSAAMIVDHDECGQALVFRPKPVGDPRARRSGSPIWILPVFSS